MSAFAGTSLSAVRLAGVVALLSVPLAGLLLLLTVTSMDLVWKHQPAHFWLVLGVAILNVVLAVVMGEAAGQRNDARLFLVAMTLLASAGFLALHALATPGVLLTGPTEGFVIAHPVGLGIAAVFAVASTVPGEDSAGFGPRKRLWVRVGLGAVLVAWAIASLFGFGWLSHASDAQAPGFVRWLALFGVLLYGIAAFRYLRLYQRRAGLLPIAIAAAFILLAEALLAAAVSMNWHAAWWEWHVLMAIAFAVVLVATRRAYRQQGTMSDAFADLYLQRTLERIDTRDARALRELATAISRGDSTSPILGRLKDQGFSGEQMRSLEHSAAELSRVDSLLRRYVGPMLADRLRAEPSFSDLGGREREVTVLFADLAGFTRFCEGRAPGEIIEMVNAYWERAVPAVTSEGGLVERFAGDAILVVFNALGDQADHAERAVTSARGIWQATERLAREHPFWPRFRIGVNTGPVVIGNVGAGGQRSLAALGDATNVAARLQAAADPGQILISRSTRERLPSSIATAHVGSLSLKGREEAVEAFTLTGD